MTTLTGRETHQAKVEVGIKQLRSERSMTLTGRETHPLIPLLTAEEEAAWPAEEIAQFYDLRRQAIGQTLADPLRYGYEPGIWLKADEAIGSLRRRFPTGVLLELDLGGNRASKTERRAKRLVQNLGAIGGLESVGLAIEPDLEPAEPAERDLQVSAAGMEAGEREAARRPGDEDRLQPGGRVHGGCAGLPERERVPVQVLRDGRGRRGRRGTG
jgi:hypothetical protein